MSDMPAVRNVRDNPESSDSYVAPVVYISLEPSTVRSRFAEFAPENEGKNVLLGAGPVGPAAAAMPALLNDRKDKK